MNKTTRQQYEEAYRLARMNAKSWKHQSRLEKERFDVAARTAVYERRQRDTMIERKSRRGTGLPMPYVQSERGTIFFM